MPHEVLEALSLFGLKPFGLKVSAKVCESRNVKANSNAEEFLQQRAGEHLNMEGKDTVSGVQPREETWGRSVTGNWSPEDWGWSLEF